jgi:2-oxoglutarate ferredoxin oxidoreductase subunit alpha
MAAFDLAERLQTPVFVLSDLDIGMNNWVSEPFTYPEKPLDRGKVLSKEDLDRLGSFQRYKDVDGDGIGWRTLPGTKHPNAAWFARGSGHNEKAQYSERPEDYTNNLDRLEHKWQTARTVVPAPLLELTTAGAKIGLIAFGSSHWAVVESVDQLQQQGIAADYLRLRAYPFSAALQEFVDAHERVYVIEQNRDAQMLQLIKMDIAPAGAVKLRRILHYSGHPLEAQTVTHSVVSQEQK